MADTPTEIKTPLQNQINPPSIIKTIERDYGACKIVGGVMKLTKEGVIVTLDNPESRKKTADTFSWSKEERQKLNEEVLIGNLRKKLVAKYPEQKCFFDKAQIRLMELGETYETHNEMLGLTKSNIFVLFGPDGKILSYLDNDGNTLFDISTFNFDDDFANLLGKKKLNKYIRKNKEGFLEYYYDGEIFHQGSPEFNSIVANFHIFKKLIK